MLKKKKKVTDASKLRQRAKETLKKASVDNDYPVKFSTDEMKTLIYDLDIYQIELEMQNHELKRSQAELEIERARYFDFYNTAPVGFFNINEQELILECNLTAAKMLGKNRTDIIKQPITRFIMEEDQDIYYLYNKQFFEPNNPQGCDLRMLKNDGSALWVHLETTVVQNIEGHTVNRMVISDITERKQAEIDLLQSEKKYRNLFENGSDLLCLHDLKGNLLDTNLAHKKEYGWQHKDIVDKNIRDLIPEQHKLGFDQYLKQIVKNGKDEGYFKGYTKSGQKIIMEYHSKLIFDKNGQPEEVQATARDITDRWKAEKKIESSEKRYRTLFEKAEDAIFVLDTSKEKMGMIVDANQSAATMHGYSLEEIKKLNIKDLDAPAHATAAEEKITAMLKGEWIQKEINHVKKDGTVFPVEINAGLIEIDKSKYILAIDRDIHERKEFENRLKRSEKMETIGNLAGGIAHDFNNILGAIIGYSELLKEDIQGDETSAHFLDQILQGGFRAKKLVSQILLFSRQNDHEMVQVKIIPLVKEVKKMLSATLPSTIDFKMNILTTYDLILADPTQIHQILMNLFTNSAHAMREKGGTLSIEIDHIKIDQDALKNFQDVKKGDYLILQISDTGHGIPSDLMDKIFDPFFSTKPRGEGTGLGLSVVQGIVKKCDGVIKVYSDVGKGTTFQIFLPLIEEGEQENSMEKLSIPKGNENILFVDDEQALVDLEKTMLERLGYKVTGITNSKTAWQIFQKNPDAFDMVITDKSMPGLSGLELSKKLVGLSPKKPIVMCTGFGDEDSIKQAKKIGIRGFINKPILQIELTETIREIFDHPDKGEK